MRKKWLGSSLVAAALCLGLASPPAAQELEAGAGAGGPRFGLQASTNFEQMLVGLKIQMKNWAVTPKAGLFVQTHDGEEDTAFAFTFGTGIDYYMPGWREGRLRPYIGDDILFFISDQDDTDVWVVNDLHVGAEYWLSDSFSFGGNIGAQLGFGDSRYTPNTLGVVHGEANFSFGFGGILHLTYYF